MRRIFLFISMFGTLLYAGEGLPVLTLPRTAHEGYCPANFTEEDKGILFTYAGWYYDTDYSSILVNYGDYQFGFQGLISGNIEIRGDVPSVEPVGTTAYYNSTLYAGKNWQLADDWSLYTRAKIINERLYYAGSWGAAADAGLVYAPKYGWQARAGFENLGRMSALLNEHTRLPGRYYLGGSLYFRSFALSLNGGVSGDLAAFYRLGVSYIHKLFSVNYSYDNLQGIHHVAAALKWNNFHIAYGQFFHQSGLGYPMMFTIGMQF